MRRSLILVLLTLLAACGPTRQERLEALNRLVGQPEAAVVSQLGLPHRIYETGGIRFLAYAERRLGFVAGHAAWGPGWVTPLGAHWGPHGWHGHGYVTPLPPAVDLVCETTFEIAGGLVRQVALRGPGCGPG